MVRWKTKIALHALATIMTHKLVRLLCWRTGFSSTKHKGEGELWQNKLDIQSDINTDLLLKSRHTCNIIWHKTDRTGISQKYIQHMWICVCVCVCCNGDDLYYLQSYAMELGWYSSGGNVEINRTAPTAIHRLTASVDKHGFRVQ